MCIRDSGRPTLDVHNTHDLAVLFAEQSHCTQPVSYTHLDVYKRQQFRRNRKTGGTVSLQEALESDGDSALTLADVLQDKMCIRDRIHTGRVLIVEGKYDAARLSHLTDAMILLTDGCLLYTSHIDLVGSANAPAVVVTQNDTAVVLFRGGASAQNAVENLSLIHI